MPTVSGKWKWNKIVSPEFYGLTQPNYVSVDFVSNSTDYWSILFYTTPRVIIAYEDTNDSTDYGAGVEGTSLIFDEDYRIIDFGDTEQSVSQFFYDYLTANAKPEGEWDDEEPEPEPEEPPVVDPPVIDPPVIGPSLPGTVAEKLVQIAKNAPRVYNAGYVAGQNDCTHNILDVVEILPTDFSSGSFTESLPEGYYAHAATIQKPANLTPENIAEGVTIAEITGTHKGGSSVEGTVTVTFCNYDGTVLYSKPVFIDDDCTDPVAQGKLTTPTKESTAQYNYTFNGWSRTAGGTASSTALKNITADKTVYAGYSSSSRKYTVRFYDGDTLMQESKVAYGGTATPPNTDKEGYNFAGWTPNDLTITGDTDFIGNWVEALVVVKEIEDDWETIIASVNDGTYATKYKLGNYKPIVVKYNSSTEATMNMQIVAFNTDEKADGSGTAPITWVSMEIIGFNETAAYFTGFKSWDEANLKIRDKVNSSLKGYIQNTAIKNAMVPVIKYTRNSSGGNTKTTDTVWPLSAREICDTATYKESVGVEYTHLYPDASSRIKHHWNAETPSEYILRTFHDSNTFRKVNKEGGTTTIGQTQGYSVAFGFCT